MKKKKKGKVRWLAVLLAGCLLLSIVPATAFASEDTDPTKSENAVGEETQLTEQQNATEESTAENGTTEETKMESVTPAPKKDETKATNNGVSGTSVESKNDKAEEPQPSEQPDTEAESKISEQPDAEGKSTTENALPAERGVTDVSGGQGVEVKTTVRNNYTDTRTEETVTYTNGVALVDGDQSALNGSVLTFIGLGDLTIQAAYDSASNKTTLTLDISNIQRQTEEKQYFTEYKENKSRMTTTYDGSKLSYTDSITDPVTETGKVIIYEIRDDYYTRNHVYERACLIIPAAESESITSATVQNAKFDYQSGDAPQATAWVAVDDTDKYEIAYECWQQFENNEPVAAWYSDNGSHGSLPTITKFEGGKKYVYFVMLKQKDGYSFSSETAVTVNGESVKSSLSGEFLYVPAVKTITPTQQTSAITSVDIENVKLDYQPGSAPQASAKRGGADQGYDISYECWEKREKDANDTLNTVGYWYSDESNYSDGDVRFSTFEKGGRYRYSVKLQAKDGYTFDSSLTNGENVTLNGASLPSGSWVMVMDDGKTCLIQYETELRPGQAVEKIDFNARINFNAGDKPSFMTSAVNPFIDLDHERWDANDGSGYGITSSDYWNERYNGKLITEFEAGKSYTYGVYFKISDLGMEEGYRFDKNTKLYINGKEITLTPDQIDVDDNGETIWFSNVLTMTPETGGTTPSEKYTVTYTDGVDGEEIFKDQTYTAESGKATPAFSGTPTRKGYKFTGWSPAVTDTVTGNVTYTAQWEKVETPAETFTVTYTDGVDNEEIFKDQTYTVESGKATPAFNGTPVRDGYKFAGWSPAVTDTVTGNVTYTAQWEKVETPAETFTVTYTDGVDNEEIFKDQTYTVESGKATPAFNGTPTRKNYTFVGWKPSVAATVTGNATYEATWKSNSATTTPSDNKPNTGETTSPKTGDTGNGKNTTTLAENKSDTVTNPKTGDTSNIVLWIALLFGSCGAMAVIMVIGKKKKTMR